MLYSCNISVLPNGKKLNLKCIGSNSHFSYFNFNKQQRQVCARKISENFHKIIREEIKGALRASKNGCRCTYYPCTFRIT